MKDDATAPDAPSLTSAMRSATSSLQAEFEHLERLSNALLNALAAEDVHQIAQLLFQRGERIRAIQAYDLTQQSADVQAFLKQKMDAVEFLEPAIQLKIGALTRAFADKLNQTREQKWLVRRYKTVDDDSAADGSRA